MFGEGIKRGISVALLCLGILGAIPARSQGKSAPTAPGAGSDVLDQKRIHNEYNEGNFEAVTAALEGFMARNKSYRLADSVFIAKHLAVVYSANTATREKGKYYMYRLLELLPSAKLVDMYVSDEIDRIFDKVREEFITRQKSFGVDSSQYALAEKPSREPASPAAPATPATPPAKPRKERSTLGTAFWVGGSAAIATAAAAFYFMNAEPETEQKLLVVHDRNPQ